MLVAKEEAVAVGIRIRSLREALKLPREKLAEKADISPQFLAEIEYGNKSMTLQTLRKLATALDVSTDFIVYGVNNSRELGPIDELLLTLSPYQITCAHEILRQYAAAIRSATPPDGEDE